MIFKISQSVWAILFACLCMLALGVADNIRGPLFPELIQFFGVSNSAGSLSFAFASGAALVGTLFSNFLLKHIQLDRLLTLSVVMMGLGLLVMALAPVFVLFMLGSVIFGFGMGTSGVSQNLLIAEYAPADKQTKVLSFLHGLYGLSSFVAPFLASRSPLWFQENFPQLARVGYWRSGYVVTAGLCLLVYVVILLCQPKPAFKAVAVATAEEKKNINKKALACLSLFFAGYVAAEILVSSRLALYMRTYYGMDLEQSSNFVTYFFVFLLAGRMFYALKSISIPIKIQMNLSLLLSVIFILLGLTWHPFFLALTGLSMAPFYPMSISYISELTGPNKRTYVTAAMAVQSVFVILMHVGVGYLTDVFGLLYAFGLGLVLLGVAIICLNIPITIRRNS